MKLVKKMKEFEKEQIIQALETHKGHMYNAAIALGIRERQLYRKVIEHEIDAKGIRAAAKT